MVRIRNGIAAITVMILWFAVGCPTSPGVGSGDEDGDDDVGTIVANDGDDGSEDGTNDEPGPDDTTDGVDGGGAPDDDSDQLPQAISLDGIWEDNGRRVTVSVTIDAVEAYYVEEQYCDRENGPVDSPESTEPGADVDSTTIDFVGTLTNGEVVLPGDTITGILPDGGIITCRSGFEDGNNGWVFASFNLIVEDENTMSGEYQYDSDGDGEPDATASLLLTRVQ